MCKLIGDRHGGKRKETCAEVAAYCDARLGDANPYGGHLHKWGGSLNQDVKKQL